MGFRGVALAAVVLSGCSWFDAELRDVTLDGDLVRDIADAVQSGDAEVTFEATCRLEDGVATCEVLGTSTVLPGDLAARIVEDIGVDAVNAEVRVKCTVHVQDMDATSCQVDLGDGYKDVPVDAPTEPPPAERDRSRDHDRGGKAGRRGKGGGRR